MAFFGYPIICKEQTSQAVLFFWMTSWLFNQKEGLFVHVTDGCCSPRPAIQPFFRVKPVGDWFGKSQDATYPIQNSRSLTESCFGRTNGEFCSVFFFHLRPTPPLWSWQQDLEKDGEEANGAVDDPPPEEGGHPVGGPGNPLQGEGWQVFFAWMPPC